MNKILLITVVGLNSFVGCFAMDRRGLDLDSVKQKQMQQCALCKTGNREMMVLPCKHHFCNDCTVASQLEKPSTLCPVCEGVVEALLFAEIETLGTKSIEGAAQLPQCAMFGVAIKRPKPIKAVTPPPVTASVSPLQDVTQRAVSPFELEDDETIVEHAQPTAAKRPKIVKTTVSSVTSVAVHPKPPVRRYFACGVELPVPVRECDQCVMARSASIFVNSDPLGIGKFSPEEQLLARDIFFGYCFRAQGYFDQGVNVHFGDDHLMKLAMSGSVNHCGRHVQAMDWLLNHGCNVHFNADEPMKKAIMFRDWEMIQLLIAHGVDAHFNKNEVMRVAIERRNFKTIKFLIEDKGFEILEWGPTLMRCAICTPVDCIMAIWLLDKRVSITRPFIDGIISRRCCTLMCELIKHGVDVRSYRNAFVEKALVTGSWDTIKLLLDRGIVNDEFVRKTAVSRKDSVKVKKILELLKDYTGHA